MTWHFTASQMHEREELGIERQIAHGLRHRCGGLDLYWRRQRRHCVYLHWHMAILCRYLGPRWCIHWDLQMQREVCYSKNSTEETRFSTEPNVLLRSTLIRKLQAFFKCCSWCHQGHPIHRESQFNILWLCWPPSLQSILSAYCSGCLIALSPNPWISLSSG